MNDPQTTGCMPLARVLDEPPSDGSIGSIGRRILQNAVRQSASAFYERKNWKDERPDRMAP